MVDKGLNIPQIAHEYMDKLSKIKVCLFDVDGILTNGQIYWHGEEVGFNRFFHAHDGYGLKILMGAGIKVGIITGGDSEGVMKRFTQLGVDYLYIGNEDKRKALDEIMVNAGVDASEVLYMGDEFFDLPLLTKVGFSATVPSASFEIRDAVDYITHRDSGQGCAREVIDMLRFVQKIIPDIEY